MVGLGAADQRLRQAGFIVVVFLMRAVQLPCSVCGQGAAEEH